MTEVQTPTQPSMSEQVDLTTIPVSPERGTQPADEITDDDAIADDPEKPITVFHDKENFNVKHQLANRWTLWFTKPSTAKVRLSS